jgi:hypothetical protein
VRAEQTTIIVGAGASAEVGLPIARRLVEDILSLLGSDGRTHDPVGHAILDSLLESDLRAKHEIVAALKASLRVREGLAYANSIDAFIDIHRDDPRMMWCGKLAIAQAILNAEKRSALAVGQNSGFANAEVVSSSWFSKFMRYMTDGIRKSDLDRIFERVSFIVFNYDRCVEHFLYHALQKLYSISESHSASLLSGLRIYHPYGTIADLPWQEPKSGVEFGHSAKPSTVHDMSTRIRTFTEQMADEALQTKMHELVSSADTLLFLGFSFHEQNMQLIDSGRECQARQVFGTAFGISPSNVEAIVIQIRALVRRNLMRTGRRGSSYHEQWEDVYIRNDLKCADLVDEYSRSLFTSLPR